MTPLEYPGVNRNLRYLPWERDDALNYPVGCHHNSYGSESIILQLREVAMMILMEKLTDKSDWCTKIFDDEIVNKWRREALQQSETGLFRRLMENKEDNERMPQPQTRIMSEAAFDFCIAELRSKARYYKQTSLLPTLDTAGSCIVKSDEIVLRDIHNDIKLAFQQLQAEQGASPDWHPYTNTTVQDLVHPSMYPFVYDRSRFIQDEAIGVDTAIDSVGQGSTVPKNGDRESSVGMLRSHHDFGVGGSGIPPEYWSNTYQWLPANLAFRDNGTVRFTSYVNNLHPKKHPEIYRTIERLVDAVLPAWDQCLQECVGMEKLNGPGRRTSRFDWIDAASDCDGGLWTSFNDDLWKAFGLPTIQEGGREQRTLPPVTIYEDEKLFVQWAEHREPIFPEPKMYEEVNYLPKDSLREKFRETGLQIIVKMASIELTPEKPEFDGGGWHVEGQMNERICATALYYVDCENITPSHLSFRKQTSAYLAHDIQAEQDQYNWLERVHGTLLGCRSSAVCLQTYGDVETRQGRVIAFPNTFQHRVSPFSLKDKSKPGHRRFIALWLVDPHSRIISTANVPPQQKDWWVNEMGWKSPQDVPGGLMSVEEAEEHRLKLMEIRTGFKEMVGKMWENTEYGFCEH